jgi:hypothetical protein
LGLLGSPQLIFANQYLFRLGFSRHAGAKSNETVLEKADIPKKHLLPIFLSRRHCMAPSTADVGQFQAAI